MTTINTSFKEIIKTVILNNKQINKFYLKRHSNTKYILDDILNDIIYVLKTGISWRDLRSPIHWKSVYFHFQRFIKNNIFKSLYLKLRNAYFSNHKTDIQIIDSTFIANKYGKNKIARNIFFKNKNCNKVSFLTDVNGVPLSVLVNTGNVHDNSFIDNHVHDIYIVNKKRNDSTILLADKAYEGKNIRFYLNIYGYSLMVPKKKKSVSDDPFDASLYKKRIFVEHSFQKLKVFRRIAIRYDSLMDTYLGFLFLAVSHLIFKKIY